MQNNKRKNTSAVNVIITGRGCLLTGFMLAIGLLAGIAGTAFFLPQVMNFKATENALRQQAAGTTTALSGWEAALYATNEAYLYQATQLAQAAVNTQQAQLHSAQATQLALDNAAALLNQTATQSTRNIVATQTANAIFNSAQMTQIALNYAATQAQLQRNATEVELNFQATRAALGDNTTTENRPETVPTATSTPLITRTPTPTAAVLLNLEDTFDAGLNISHWNTSNTDAWQNDSSGLRAAQDNAWLLTNRTVGSRYRLEIDLIPALAHQAEEYSILLNTSEAGSYTLVFRVEALTLRQLRLLKGTETQTMQTYNMSLTGDTRIVVLLDNYQIQVELNSLEILQTDIDETLTRGVTGVRFPMGAVLKRIKLVENP